jgi:hypothetical protein
MKVDRAATPWDIRIVDAPHFCATKLDGYADRGRGYFSPHDTRGHHRGRRWQAGAERELAAAGIDVRRYVA